MRSNFKSFYILPPKNLSPTLSLSDLPLNDGGKHPKHKTKMIESKNNNQLKYISFLVMITIGKL